MGVDEHRADAPREVSCFIITVSDTRTEENDESGRLLREALARAGHRIAGYRLIRDDPELLGQLLREQVGRGESRAIILSGGTGISRRDSTHEAVTSLLEKRLDGFGEIFRALSYQEIGAAAIMTRAVAGTMGGVVVISLPGSAAAVRLALDKLILPELGHMVREAGR